MAGSQLLTPTLHVEVRVRSASGSQEVYDAVKIRLLEDYDALEVGQRVDSLDGMKHEENVIGVEIADYTGPYAVSSFHTLSEVDLDVQCYTLKPEREPDPRKRTKQLDEDHVAHVRILALPNAAINEAWASLAFEDALPTRLLRYLVRMVDMMRQPDLNLSAFNWNRLCLLHGPPGSGKSTLCRALAQKLSIRLGTAFNKAMFVEINTNSLLSKYFGESGKQIGSVFDQVYSMCQDRKTLVCVVMDEVETIAGSREKAAEGSECADGLRATNQLLTALDRIRNLPNVIVLCTSNLIEAIDPAFIDRVDIKQYIPCPSPSAIYNIFRSCLNELVRSHLVGSMEAQPSPGVLLSSSTDTSPTENMRSSSPQKPNTRAKAAKVAPKTSPKPSSKPPSSSPEQWNLLDVENQVAVPSFAEMKVRSSANPDPHSAGERVWALAQQCHGFSGRILRRLPILALAMYTWGGHCTVQDAISALEKAVEQEIAVVKEKRTDVKMEDA